jgi:hypothetical protein
METRMVCHKTIRIIEQTAAMVCHVAGDDLNGGDIRGDRASPIDETNDKDLRKNQALPNPIPV